MKIRLIQKGVTNEKNQFIVFFILFLLVINLLAQEGPTRKDASAEYCVLQGETPLFILTKIITPMHTESLSHNDTLWCNYYSSSSLDDFIYPGSEIEYQGMLGGGGGGVSIIMRHSVVKDENGAKVVSREAEIVPYEPPMEPYPATIALEFPEKKEIFIPDSIVNKKQYIKNFSDSIILVQWRTYLSCKPRKDTTLKTSSFVYITGPCLKGTKIKND